MLDEFLALSSKFVFSLLLFMIECDDLFGNVSQFIVWEDIFGIVLLQVSEIAGKIAQFRNRLPDAERKAREDEEKDHDHQRHEVNKIFVDGQNSFHIRVVGYRHSVDIIVDVGRGVKVTFSCSLRLANGKALLCVASLLDFRAVVMVRIDIIPAIIEQDFAFGTDDSHPDIPLRYFVQELLDDTVGMLRSFVEETIMELVIIRFQDCIQFLLRELLFPLILE